MRVWGYADPRLLNRKHLLGEHREVHALLNDEFNWGTNPEYRRFADLPGSRGRALLVLRHELVRVAMNTRYRWKHLATGQYDTCNLNQRLHPTLMDDVDMALLTPRMRGVLKAYERDAYVTERHTYDTATCDERFHVMMASVDYPPCRLEGGAETPWDRDGFTLDEYLTLGDEWSKAEHHAGVQR